MALPANWGLSPQHNLQRAAASSARRVVVIGGRVRANLRFASFVGRTGIEATRKYARLIFDPLVQVAHHVVNVFVTELAHTVRRAASWTKQHPCFVLDDQIESRVQVSE